MGLPPEGGEKGMPSSIPSTWIPQAAIHRNFISMVLTALPLSTHNFLGWPLKGVLLKVTPPLLKIWVGWQTLSARDDLD